MKVYTNLVLPEREAEKVTITASLIAEGIRCRRRLWLNVHGFQVWEQREFRNPSLGLRALHLPSAGPEMPEWWKGGEFEVPLPTGDRLDAWFTDEAVGIEYKSGAPHAAHIYQVWSFYRVFARFAITGVQMQLWYPAQWKDEAAALADSFGYGWMPLLEGQVAAVRVDPPDPIEADQLDRMISVLEEEQGGSHSPEVPWPADHPVCSECPYHDFCHIRS